MDEEFHEWGKVKWLWLAALLVSEAASLVAGARAGGQWMALQMGGGVLVLFVLLFSVYYFWRRTRARKTRRIFSAAIQAQSAIAPRSVNDPNQRAALDRLRQKFQEGLNQFTSRGRDIYKLPWYLIIGESGSGKTEAIRHSGIDFPPGLQNELQGSGGTVNMDWWFTNHGVLLDTAGRLLFGETETSQSPEWTEFLKLMKKARSHCPINGLFIVLSVESLIKDSADKIAQKAKRMAEQLDLIQRTLDVRFPVYLLVSKCDLLTGFRDFFESVDDPLLQHQMLGWSNPDPLDAPFRADLVDEYLRSVVLRIRRRRLWLMRESFIRRLAAIYPKLGSSLAVGVADSTQQRPEDAEALFALPESLRRLAPRLRRYLEKIFVTGEWSAKPVFLRGIFFTSSMREGNALDEAIALATGLPLDQLPEDSSWDKHRAFFLRDLFMDKVFREAGLVTPATNTLKLMRSRQLSVYGASALALVLVLGFALWANHSLSATVRREAEYWKYAASHPNLIVHRNGQEFDFMGNTQVNIRVPLMERKPSLIEFHSWLQHAVEKPVQTAWVFKPLPWLRVPGEPDRQDAQLTLFMQCILKPLISQTRLKMERPDSLVSNQGAIERHRDALLALLQLEVDGVARKKGKRTKVESGAAEMYAEMYLGASLSYLVGKDQSLDPKLVDLMTHAIMAGKRTGEWPPVYLLAGESLITNIALKVGLDDFLKASVQAQTAAAKASVSSFRARVERMQEDLTRLGASSDLCRDVQARLEAPVSHSAQATESSRSDHPAASPKLERDSLRAVRGRLAFEQVLKWRLVFDAHFPSETRLPGKEDWPSPGLLADAQ